MTGEKLTPLKPLFFVVWFVVFVFMPLDYSTELAYLSYFLHYAWGAQEVLTLCARHTRGTTGGTSCESPPLKEREELISNDESFSFTVPSP